MILFSLIFAFLVWIFICWAVMRLVLWLLIRQDVLNKDKTYFYSRNIVLLLMVSAPFWQDIFIHYYQKITFPKVCEQYAGYHPKEPIKLTSLYSENGYWRYILLPHVEFVEWEYKKDNSQIPSFWRERFGNDQFKYEPGKYRFRLYQEGADQCEFLRSMYPEIDKGIESSSIRFQKNHYPLKNLNGKCIGVEVIDRIEARYNFVSGRETIKTRFGYSALIEFVGIFDREMNQYGIKYQDVFTASDVAVLNFIDFTPNFFKFCEQNRSYIYANDPERSEENFGLYKDYKIKRGLLDLD